MPTIDQNIEYLKKKREKWGGSAHCNQVHISEEIRKEAIENKPDTQGRQRTRIALECYSPEAYSAWNEMLEMLMERCGFNPILVVDLLRLLVYEAQKRIRVSEADIHNLMDGLDLALSGLYKVQDYEQALRDAKAQKRNRRQP